MYIVGSIYFFIMVIVGYHEYRRTNSVFAIAYAILMIVLAVSVLLAIGTND